jgi:hypothetical protein
MKYMLHLRDKIIFKSFHEIVKAGEFHSLLFFHEPTPDGLLTRVPKFMYGVFLSQRYSNSKAAPSLSLYYFLLPLPKLFPLSLLLSINLSRYSSIVKTKTKDQIKSAENTYLQPIQSPPTSTEKQYPGWTVNVTRKVTC